MSLHGIRASAALALLISSSARTAAADDPGAAAQRASAPGGVAGASAVDAALGDAEALCRYHKAQAAGQGALLGSPRLFANALSFQGVGDLTSPDGVSLAVPTRGLTARLQVGASWSLSDLRKRWLVRDAASARCAELRAVQADVAPPGPTGTPEPVSEHPAAALQAKLAVLRAARPEAQSKVAASAAMVAAGTLAAPAHDRLLARLDALDAAIAAAEDDLLLAEARSEASAQRSRAKRPDMRAVRDSARRAAEAALRVDRASAMDVTIRVGYDEILDVEQRYPLLAGLQLSLSPGWFAARQAHRAAAQAYAERAESAARQVDSGADDGRLAERLRESSASRLAALAATARRLDERIKALRALPGREAGEYADELWFEALQVAAERAFHEARRSQMAAHVPDAR